MFTYALLQLSSGFTPYINQHGQRSVYATCVEAHVMTNDLLMIRKAIGVILPQR